MRRCTELDKLEAGIYHRQQLENSFLTRYSSTIKYRVYRLRKSQKVDQIAEADMLP